MSDQDNANDARFELALDRTTLGRPDLALPEIEALLATHPDEPRYRVGHAAVLNRLGRHTEAIKVLDDVLASHPSLPDAWLGLAEANRDLERTSAWIAAVRQAEALNPESPAVQVWLYHVALAEGRVAESAEHLKRALELHPPYVPAHIAIGTFAWNAGDLDTAESWLASAAKMAPWDGRTQGVLALFRAETGRGDPDLARLEGEALALPYGRLPLYLGELYLKAQDDAERAVRFLEVAVQHGPEDVQTLTLLGDAHIDRGAYEAAAAALQRAVDLGPETGAPWSGLAFARMRQGRLVEAAEAYAIAAARLPDEPTVRQGYGLVLLDLGRVQESLAELRAAVALEPENEKIQSSLARAQDAARRLDMKEHQP